MTVSLIMRLQDIRQSRLLFAEEPETHAEIKQSHQERQTEELPIKGTAFEGIAVRGDDAGHGIEKEVGAESCAEAGKSGK